MFSKKQTTDFSKFDTLIGKNTAFEGTLTAEGTIRIDGNVKGDVKVEGDIYIGESSQVIGNIMGSNIIVGGNVDGNIMANEQLRLTSTGKVIGDISVKSLIIDENGVFEGSSKMTANEINSKYKSKKSESSSVEN
ncbi:polymer-forming cytoskeletal protein [Alkaliphilus sp. MSJ-5]|uniref:Polymer-forming cytoskeletal protein n=1 Tax=Alkaliphilus flagellatus TaxID=2841507 RepID=A0ABS6G0S6_9FIRM|nr:polymer-forming cytoskeletal protein [Alkaliphilus flagellatus]MBU5675944.1 polymer-forming cytoskeletal protein [Alkaliphilus flagellatus]